MGNLVKAVAASVAAVTLASACIDANGPFVVTNVEGAHALEALFNSAAGAGPVLVRMNGNPLGGDDTALAAVAHGAMADAVIGREVTFTGNAAHSPQPQNNLAVIFNPGPGADSSAWCRKDAALPAPQAPDGDTLRVRMAFCASGEMLSEVEGVVRGVAAPTDRRFHQLFFDLGNRLLMQQVIDAPCPGGDTDC